MVIKIVTRKNRKRGRHKTVKIDNLVIQPDIKLLELPKLGDEQIEQLANITNNMDIMKSIGTGKPWTIDDIHSFIKDEKKDQKLHHHKRQYYSYVILYLYNGIYRVVGYISGRKKRSILTNPFDKNPDNIILRILVDSNYQGKGIGKHAVKLFIEKYKNIIKVRQNSANSPVIIADIDKNNIGSIKTMLANGFKYYGVIKYYVGGKELNRYIINLI